MTAECLAHAGSTAFDGVPQPQCGSCKCRCSASSLECKLVHRSLHRFFGRKVFRLFTGMGYGE